jgi:hypothetical protein
MRLKVDLDKLNPDIQPVDVSRWFKRFELFIDVHLEAKPEVDKKAEYLRILPLYLAGSALLCFEELPYTEQQDYEMIKLRLSSYHQLDDSQAYNKFISSKYEAEGVDVFIAQLRRLLCTTLGVQGPSADKLILHQFLHAIPAPIAAELRTRCTTSDMAIDLQTVVNTARHLPSLQSMGGAEIIGAIQGQPNNTRHKTRPTEIAGNKPRGQPSTGGRRNKQMTCFVCGADHMMRDCPLIQQIAQGNDRGSLQSQAACKTSPPTLAARASTSPSN